MIIWTVNYLILPMSILNIILVLLSSLHELFFALISGGQKLQVKEFHTGTFTMTGTRGRNSHFQVPMLNVIGMTRDRTRDLPRSNC